MQSKMTHAAILFADISSSTKLYSILGDATARHKLATCLNVIIDAVQRHQGTVVKTIGDEVLCTFLSVEEAIEAACEINESLDAAVPETADPQLLLSARVGLHYGPVLLENGDVFGDAVNVAAHMVAIAKAGQIITTEPTVDALSPLWRTSTRFVARIPLKGKKETVNIFEILWREDDTTHLSTAVVTRGPDERIDSTTLHLTYENQQITLDEHSPFAVLGRSPVCDITIDDTLTSRHHVRIEYRRGKFYLIDQSTNGTFYRVFQGGETFLRWEEAPIHDSGQLSLGRSVSDNLKNIIHVSVES